jgi:hypothetical protein
MERLALRLIAALLAFITGVALSTLWLARRVQALKRAGAAVVLVSDAAGTHALKKTASHEGVSFDYDASLASEVKAESKPEFFEGKPGDVEPAHFVFSFPSSYAAATHGERAFFLPEIHIYPVAGYRKTFAKYRIEGVSDRVAADNSRRDFEDQLRTLKTMLSQRPASARSLKAVLSKNRRDFLKGDMPFLPLIDASEALRARVRYIDFQGGKGVVFLTQYNIEDTLVTNHALAYVFQGLTDDGAQYISATFPVAAPFLPEDYTEAEAERLGLKQTLLLGTNLEKRYLSYLAQTARRLDALPPTQFRPDLNLFDELFRSLRVRKQS